jgi:hypothetical protein
MVVFILNCSEFRIFTVLFGKRPAVPQMRTPEGHKIQRSAKCAIAHERADDKADVVLLDAYLI